MTPGESLADALRRRRGHHGVGRGLRGDSGDAARRDHPPGGERPPRREAGDRIGGRGHRRSGADAFLARVPEAVELCEELGLTDELASPVQSKAYVWWDGALRPVPEGTVLGVPVDAEPGVSDLLDADELAQAQASGRRPRLPLWGRDPSVGRFARSIAGPAAAARMVDPLVGAINAGDPNRLSLRAVTPQLAEAAAGGGRVAVTLRARRAAADPEAPAFLAPESGMERLVEALEAKLAEADVRTASPASSVQPADTGGWLVWASPEGGSSSPVHGDAVVLAPPAPVAADLLADVAPRPPGSWRASSTRRWWWSRWRSPGPT